MLEYNLTRVFHFLGVALWLGATIASALLAAYAAEAGSNISAPARRVLRTVAVPAMLAAWLGGLGMAVPVFSEVYARAGWFHGKLTLVLVASGLSGAVSAVLRKSEGGEVPVAKLRGFAIALLVIAIVVICLAVLKPGAGLRPLV